MTDACDRLRDVLDERAVVPVYQPLVDLDRQVVVGYEALARGPRGGLHTPDGLFAAARAAGRLVELDWLCREQAVDGARRAGLRHPLSLFVNAEPETLLATAADGARWAQFSDVRCYAELTERALAASPGALLRAVDQVREQDWGIALDDVGVEPASLALLPLLRPDVIKLDLRLLHERPGSPGDTEVARVVHGALAQATATGAVVVAEGIETEQHLDLALAYGAHYGQGFLLGRPAPLPPVLESPPVPVPLVRRPIDRAVLPGPFAVVASGTPTRQLRRAALQEVARQLLAHAAQLDQPLVLVCASDADLLDGAAREVLHALAAGPLTALLGRPPAVTSAGSAAVTSVAAVSPVAALRTHRLDPQDPAGEDFDVVVLAPHFAGALVSRPALSGPPGAADAVLTFDRDLVSAAANALVRRL